MCPEVLFLCLTALAELAVSLKQYEPPQCEQSKVLILGAGMAGISAGHTLTQQNITDFKIIEYQDRVGGRTLHRKFGRKADGSQWTVELGTNWITGVHSIKGTPPDDRVVNPIWRLAEQVNLTTTRSVGPEMCYDENGPSNWCSEFRTFARAESQIIQAANNRVKHGKEDISVRAALRLAGWDPFNDMQKQAVEWLIWDADGAAALDLSSLIFGALSVDALIGPSERFVLDQRGYDVVTRQLADSYLTPTDDRLVLNSPVTEITYSNVAVTIHTSDGSCYSAEHAICTFSLGVLQHAVAEGVPVRFVPELPMWKKESIVTNVMGIYTKIFYQFDHVFWPRHIQNFYFAHPSIRGYWTLWESLDFPGSPLEGSGIIFGTMVWDQSMRVEQQSDQQTMEEGLAVLRQMFPNASIPQPLDFFYPRWGLTPWSFGSYSNWAVGYTLEQHTNFRANVGRLWFAGEATSSDYWGYLHGAFYEGKLAAQEIGACIIDQSSCTDRKRYLGMHRDDEEDYDRANGFLHPIEELIDPI